MDDEIFGQYLEGTDIKVSISLFKGKHRVDIRKYWRDDKGEMKPSPKGINISIDEFEKFIKMIPELQEKVESLKG